MTSLTDAEIDWDHLRDTGTARAKKTSLKSEIERIVNSGLELHIVCRKNTYGIFYEIYIKDYIKPIITDKPVKYLRGIK